MSEFTVLGKFFNYDVETGILSLKLNFLDPETQKSIEQAVIETKDTKFSFKLRFKESKKYRLQKVWYGSIYKIAKSDQYKINPIAEDMMDLDDYLRESIFPVRNKIISGEEVPSVARMKHLSDEQLQHCIDKLHERYSYLTVNKSPIDFSDLKIL